MRDAGTALRAAYITALSTLGIPVVDGKVEALGSGDEWVVIGDQSDQDRSNKHKWATEITVEIDIYTRKKSVAGKKAVEDIANQILGIVLPSITGVGLTIASPFDITYTIYDNGKVQTVRQDAANTFENIKTLQFINFITQ